MGNHIMPWRFIMLIIRFIMLIIAGVIIQVNSLHSDYEVIVDVTASPGGMQRIWDNTGFSPPGPGKEAVNYLTSSDQLINLALIGSLPFKAISHVRIHWLLDLITVNSAEYGSDVKFDYNELDQLIRWLRANRLRPGLELMGNPGGLFTDLNTNPEKLVLWQEFISGLAAHYVDLFGKGEVSKWRFELWNEPDSKQYNILNLTYHGYLQYALASMKGLATQGFRISGPAGTFKDFNHHNLSWSLLQICNSMIAISGSCGLDTVTFHKKGEGDAQKVVSSTAEFYSLATGLYPLLKTLPFANNEADMLTGWWRQVAWRGDVHYAAQVCEVITYLRAQVTKQNMSLAYISNDNGFINQPHAYFNQRTLLTRFQMNNSDVPHAQFVRKPVMVATALLSYLGPKEMPVYIRHLTSFSPSNSRLSVLAAGDGVDLSPGWSGAVVIAISALLPNCSDNYLQLRLRLSPHAEFTYMVYKLDNVLTNPRSVWEKNGKPDFPDAHLLREIRSHEGPHMAETGSVQGESLTLSLQLRCPSVTMIHLCVAPHQSPAKVLKLHAVNITFNEVLLLWQDTNTRCVKTYEVYFCSGECLLDNYKLVTDRDVIMLSFQYHTVVGWNGEEGTRGRYKVRAIDYWDRPGYFSDVYLYP